MRKLVHISLLALCVPAHPQHNHHAAHGVYAGWVNQKNEGCCNGNDCGTLEEVQERPTKDGGVEVFVGFGHEPKKWCPVKWDYRRRKHFPHHKSPKLGACGLSP